MIGYLIDGETREIVATGPFEDGEHMAEQNEQAQAETDGRLYWLTPAQLAEARAEAEAELERRRLKEGDIGVHWPLATWQDIARANNPRQHAEIDVTQYYGKEF